MTSSASDVLVVDDDPYINRLVCSFLKHGGYSPRSALDGKAALAEIEQAVPGLIVLDIMLPDMTGYDICRTVKDAERTAGIPVIMISALSSEEAISAGMEAGATAYLPKPFDPDKLMLLINSHYKAA